MRQNDVGQREFDRALEMAQAAATQDSKNYRTHLWRGQLLSVVGGRKREDAEKQRAYAEDLKNKGKTAEAQREIATADQMLAKADQVLTEAEAALRQAVKLGPQAADAWEGLVQFLSIHKNADKAEEAIQEIAAVLPAPQVLPVQAQCYFAVGKIPAAQEKFEAALAAAPQDPLVIRVAAEFYSRTGKPAQAEALLRKIIDGEVQAPEVDVISARRLLADILLAGGGDANLQKARELIEKNPAEPKRAVEDRRLMARLNAADSKRSRRDEAIRDLEALVKEKLATQEDRFLLAQAYSSAGAWTKGTAQWQYLVTNYPNDLRYLSIYIDVLLRRGDTADAETYLTRLERLAPKEFITFVRHEWLVASNEWDKALDLLEQKEGNAPPVAINQLCSQFLAYGKADQKQLQRLDNMLQGALVRLNRPAVLLLAMADLRAHQGRYGDAEAFYREILAKQGRDVWALNNLAVLLALQGVKLDEALKLVNQALEMGDRWPRRFSTRGRASTWPSASRRRP